MSRLVIKNVGPIKFIDINLNKINVFIGPQSSGKSTIAKIVSFCSWLEKKRDTTEVVAATTGLRKELERYHRMKGYFSDDSSILYIGDNVAFALNCEEPLDLPEQFMDVTGVSFCKEEGLIYVVEKKVNPKVVYIPAERNFVSVLPDARKYAEEQDGLLNFITDWLESKRHYLTDKRLQMLNLGISYYYNEEKDRDVLHLAEPQQSISLNQASSGMQSLVPLLVLLDWFAEGIYEHNKPYSPEEVIKIKDILANLSKDKEGQEQSQLVDRLRDFVEGKGYTHTQFIIEEPEQNLFPKTQVEFLYALLSIINHGHPHRLVLTTHSPYILYALNNCLLAYLVQEKIDEKEETLAVEAMKYGLNPELVSVWQIDDGYLRNDKGTANETIQDEQGLIRKNYFNNVMKDVMGQFNELLNYYD